MITASIIGLGYWGPNLLRNFAATPDCTVKYACDLSQPNLDKAHALYPTLQCTTSADDIFADADVNLVIIATPTSGHYPLAKAALEAGKHVFIEKPMASSAQQCEELCSIAKENGLHIFVDHTFCFAAAVEDIASRVKGGDIGDPLYFDSSRMNLGLIQKDCNVLWDLAVHDLSILSTFRDLDDIQSVTAHGGKHYGEQDEDAHIHLTFNDSFHAHIHVSWLSPLKIRQTIIGGSKAMITYDDAEPSEKIRLYDKGVENDETKMTKADPFFPIYRAGDVVIPALSNAETLRKEAAHVIAVLQGKEEPRVPGEDGRKVVQVLERANESLEKGCTVAFS